jgi:hypothetical protein
MLIASCGGGGGAGAGGGGKAPPRPPTILSGNGVDAVVRDAIVELYAFTTDDLVPGSLMGSAVTDQDGFYSINISAPSQYVILRLKGGCYTEEASGKDVCLQPGQYLYASTYMESGKPLTVMLTPLTTFAHALTLYKVRGGENVSTAITKSNTTIASLFGVDILGTVPYNVTDGDNGRFSFLNQELTYGFIAAGFSSLSASAGGAEPHLTGRTTVALIQVLFNDIVADGMADGIGRVGEVPTQLAFGNLVLDGNTLRADLAGHILSVAGDTTINKTGIGIDALLNTAQSIAGKTDTIFGGLDTKPVDATGPSVGFPQAEGNYYNGTYTFRFTAGDLVGIKSVAIDVDGVELGTAVGDLENGSYDILTTDYIDGEHLIGVTATDKLGNETYAQHRVNFNNSGPIANITSSTHSNKALYTVTGDYVTAGVDIDTITVGGVAAAVDTTNHTFSAEVSLVLGNNNFSLVVMDTLGNQFSENFNVILDLSWPNIISIHSQAKLIAPDETIFVQKLLDENINWPIYLLTNNISLQGSSVDPNFLNSIGIPYFGFDISDFPQSGYETKPSELVIEYKYVVDGRLQFDWKPTGDLITHIGISVPVYIPLVVETLGPDFYKFPVSSVHAITVRATDLAGNSLEKEVSFKLDVRVPPATITSVSTPDYLAAGGITFANRTTAVGRTFGAVNYVFPNANNFPILIRLSDTQTHQLRNDYESAIREHKAHMRETEFWRGTFVYKKFPVFPHEYLTTTLDIDGVYLLSGSFNSGVAQLSSEAKFNLFLHDYYRTIPGTPYLGTYGEPTRTRLDKPAEVVHDYVSLSSNSLPANVSPPFAPFDPAGSLYQMVWENTLAISTEKANYEALRPIILPQPDGTTVSERMYARYTYCCSQTNPALNIDHAGLERSVHQTWSSFPGHPHTVFTPLVAATDFSTAGYVVRDEFGAEIPSVNGLYRVAADSFVTITKKITIPPVDTFNDTEVANGGFNSYAVKYFDKLWSFSTGTDISVASFIDIGYAESEQLNPQVLSYAGGISTSMVGR